ncbi:MAG: recombinase family protein, partial [Flavobacteriales bacterium]|nr:recombinase family protein [Flavobacteriales bacterium]
RVSKKDNSQDHHNQLIKLKEYCKVNDYTVYRSIVDKESGGKANREGFQEIFTEASQRNFDLLLFWSLDRFSREGALKTMISLQQLEDAGVRFKSLTEPYLDTSGIFKEAIIALLATLAKQEKIRIRERTIAGLEKARAKGRIGGRPKINEQLQLKIDELHGQGLSNRAIGKRLKLAHKTVAKYLATTVGLPADEAGGQSEQVNDRVSEPTA